MSDKVYYDESCYVCSFEINTLRKKGEACGIEFVDISDDNFDSSGRDFDTEMIGEFDGVETSGMETFRQLYDKLGFKRFVAFSRLPLISNCFDAGYYIFSRWIRPNLPKRTK